MRTEIEYPITSIEQLPLAESWLKQMVSRGLQAGKVVIRLGRERRSLDQNKKLWPMLSDISNQVNWYGKKIQPIDWKTIFMAALLGGEVVPGINGGFVIIGLSTSKLSKEKFSDLIEFMYAFGSERSVKWSEKALNTYQEYREAA